MSKLYLITHPSVQIDRDVPIDQWQLSDKGIRETKRLLNLNFWKYIKTVYTSPESKAIRVAEMAASKYCLVIKKESCLSEIDRNSTGFMEYDLYVDSVAEFYKNPQMEVNGWESAEKATKRIVECVAKIMDSTTENIVIIGHGAISTLLACWLLHKKPDFAEDPQGTGRYMIVDWDRKKIIEKWIAY